MGNKQKIDYATKGLSDEILQQAHEMQRHKDFMQEYEDLTKKHKVMLIPEIQSSRILVNPDGSRSVFPLVALVTINLPKAAPVPEETPGEQKTGE